MRARRTIVGKRRGVDGTTHADIRSRVCILQEYVPQYRAAFLQALRERLGRQGIDLIVAAGPPGPRARRREDASAMQVDVRLHQYEFSIFGQRLTLRWLPKVVLSADLLVVEQARRNIDLYLLLLAPATRRRTALWGHGSDYSHSPGRFRVRVLNWLTQRCAWFFVYTDRGRRELLASGLSPNQITVVNNSTDTSTLIAARHTVTESVVAEWKRSHDVHSQWVFAYIGAIDAGKGVRLLAQAWRVVLAEHADAILLIGGRGPDAAAFHEHGELLPGVRLLGYVGDVEKAIIGRCARLLVIPGQVGLVAVDCMALGLSLLTVEAQHGPELDYLVLGQDYFMVQADADSLAKAMLTTPPLRHSPQHEVSDVWSAEDMANRFASGIERYLADRA